MSTDPNPNNGGTQEEASLKVTSKDPKKKKKAEEDLSDEDLALKQQLKLYVQRIQDSDSGVRELALKSMKQEIQTSISSMELVPKALKFLRPYYEKLKAYHETMIDFRDFYMRGFLADILSVLAWTMSAEGKRESLKYRLLDPDEDFDSWGHEYVRNLAGEISQEYAKPMIKDYSQRDLMMIVQLIACFYLKHNAESEAVDFLMEVELIGTLVHYVDVTNYKKTCMYLTSFAGYLPGPGNMLVLELAYKIYFKFEDFLSALRIALFIDNMEFVTKVFKSCCDLLAKKQFCYILARHGVMFVIDELTSVDEMEQLQEIINITKLHEGYLTVARDIEVVDPKTPEDIYKTHLLVARASSGASDDLTRQNLEDTLAIADTFVNAFVNAGFGQDKLMTVPSEASSDGSTGSWLSMNQVHEKSSAVASLGMILLWCVDSELAQIDKYFYNYIHSNDNHVIAGALLGVGIVSCGIKNDSDPALALLGGYIGKGDSTIQIGAIMGLGLAYAGSQNEKVRRKLSPILRDAGSSLDLAAFSAISLGLIYVGSGNNNASQDIVAASMFRSELELGDPLTGFLHLGLGLLYLGKQEKVESEIIEICNGFNKKIRKRCLITLLSCAYAGTGNVLKFQELLGQCAQHEGEIHQGSAVLGIAMIAMAEEVGLDMAIRSLEHLLQYGEQNIRRAVPLALGLLCISNPKVNVRNTLSRLSHDTDEEVAMAAIISLGLIGAGTNNAQIACMLRDLSLYYNFDVDILLCVRIGQGLVHMGKGLLTLAPYHSDRFLLSKKAFAGILILLHAYLNMKSKIWFEYHYVLYFLVLAMQPRMLMTVDENLKPLSVPVQVGRAVNVAGRPGQPRTITGFQTHLTPVLLAAGERAELATEKYIPLSPILEGFVILKENPEYQVDSLACSFSKHAI